VATALWQGKVVSFEVTFEGVKWWWPSDSSRLFGSSEVYKVNLQETKAD